MAGLRVPPVATSRYSRAMDFVLSLTMLAAIALVIGAAWLRRRGGATRQMWLMLVLAGVMLANVAIWSLPPP
ncbi:hypothetical protein [Croceibacterium mercuriale]|uniref:hypothetical protein n=1 Tax=Croceibacterium mercuriale TaxID=1572751 RepID=UPI0013A07DFE|nr:hypothetical protein [Croceibacterium mercuriale]